MLKSHLDAVERKILAESRVAGNAGHPLHKGTPREIFIREFLEGHLGGRLAVGTGEIIDAHSVPGQPRNQFDIVIYRPEYPRINLGGGINVFLAESIVATIEVKSLLIKEDLDLAVRSASNAKRLERNLVTSFVAGYVPPGILSFVVAYDGPARVTTVQEWLLQSESERGLNQEALPPTFEARTRVLSASIEGIFCLGRYSIMFDNAPITPLTDDARAQHPEIKRILIEQAEGNLMWLFLLLTQAAANMTGQWANLASYLGDTKVQFRAGR